MSFLASLTARLSWFKRRDTMYPNPWEELLSRTLSEATAITLHLYTSAAEKVHDPESFLNMLDVVWMWQLKCDLKPFHEICVFETEDPKNGIRRFVLDRVYQATGGIHTEVTEVQPNTTNIEKY